MPRLIVNGLTFEFRNGWKAEKYDDWTFYRKKFQSVAGGARAVDVVALQPRECCWLIEATDLSGAHKTSVAGLADEMAVKVRDTLAGLAAARFRADGDEKRYANDSLDTTRLRVVLYVKQPEPASAMFSTRLELADVKQKLMQKIKAIDPKLQVVESDENIDWTVS